MRQSVLFAVALIIWLFPVYSYSQDNPVNFVNPFIGTGGHGHTFPGATVPFGMVQLSPDTRLEGWDGCSGYHYSDDYIYGFSHTHLSGTGVPDYCDILLMPFSSENYWNNGYNDKPGYRSMFSHDNEIASPGFYQVHLKKDDILVKLTTSERVGFHSYTYQPEQPRKIILDLHHRDKVTNSWIRQISPFEFEGYRGSNAWATDQRVYFFIQFSDSVHQVTYALNDQPVLVEDGILMGENVKTVLDFGSKHNNTIQVKVALSATSTENARKNLESEINHWNFNKVKSEAENKWNKELGKIQIYSGSQDDKTVFYTALYHTMISPNLYQDVDGSYRGRDMEVHQTDHEYYTVFSLWDTYRALHPLLTIIDQKRTNDFIKTFLKQYQQAELLPVWELSSNETFCMIGYHAVPVIFDAYVKGIRNYDEKLALRAMITSAESNLYGLPYYRQFGYIPAELEHESVSKTLEYAFDDWCIGSMAELMGEKELAANFFIRAQSYKNIFDPVTGYMRARTNGAWYEPFEPREVNYHYTEANSWQYSFYVPHNMDDFIKMHGGKSGLAKKLDDLFSAPIETTGRDQSDITGLIGQYAHGNEPSHHIAYLYNYAGQPWKTQEKVNYIMENFYSNNPDGLIGNEDCGQMSAWAIFSSLGFYPVCPGNNQYAIGTPRFADAKINLENGKSFIIKTKNFNKVNTYIKSVTLNGLDYNKSFLLHEDIMKGGIIEFEMSEIPYYSWGMESHMKTSSLMSEKLITPAPLTSNGQQSFINNTEIRLYTPEDAEIRYTTDGTEPNEKSLLYEKPLLIENSTIVKYKAYKDGFLPSQTQISKYSVRPHDRELILISRPAPQYSANGENTLIDGLTGSEDFRLGGWQGFQGIDLEAIITNNTNKPIKSINIGFLQDINAWIFMPRKVELWASSDGEDYTLLSVCENETPQDKWGTIINYFGLPTKGNADKFYKIIARNIGICPESHKGSGHPAWIFSDEIIVNYSGN